MVLSFLIHLAVLQCGTAVTIDEIEEKVHIVHAHQGRQAKILLELLGLDEYENEKVDIVEPLTYDEDDYDLNMENEDIFNKQKEEGKTRSLLGVFPFNNFTNTDHHDHDHDHDHGHHHEHEHQMNEHNHEEEEAHHHHEHDHDHEESDKSDEQETPLRRPLSDRTQDTFPFALGVKSNNDVEDAPSFSTSHLPQEINNVGVPDGKGRKCVDKVNIP